MAAKNGVSGHYVENQSDSEDGSAEVKGNKRNKESPNKNKNARLSS